MEEIRTETRVERWVDWGKRTVFVMGILQGITLGMVGYVYYKGGGLHYEPAIEAIEAQCKQFDEMKVAAWGEIGKLPGKKK